MSKFTLESAIDGADRLARISENIRRDVQRLRPGLENDRTIVVCGYGPSLRDTWQQIDPTFDVCTVSGAHDFLIERGIVPKYHVEYDPRPHKCEFLRSPRSETTYCLASTCHPKMFEQLRDSNVLMWHALGQDLQAEPQLVIEHERDGGIMLFGGSNAGSRSIMVGNVLGYRDFDLHGFDCSYLPDLCWAGPHSGEAHISFQLECNGVKFLSSPAMINSVEELWKIIHKTLRGCKFTVRGSGLLAARLKLAETDRAKAWSDLWWMSDSPDIKQVATLNAPQIESLITDGYRDQNAIMHRFNPTYGSFGHRHADAVAVISDRIGSRDVLDYGCGKRGLEAALGFQIQNYDPAIPACAKDPLPAQIVVCADVLEHVEPHCFQAVMRHLKSKVLRYLIVEVSTRPASKTLPDGRNAHLIVNNADWWLNTLGQSFTVKSHEVRPTSLIAVCLKQEVN